MKKYIQALMAIPDVFGMFWAIARQPGSLADKRFMLEITKRILDAQASIMHFETIRLRCLHNPALLKSCDELLNSHKNEKAQLEELIPVSLSTWIGRGKR